MNKKALTVSMMLICGVMANTTNAGQHTTHEHHTPVAIALDEGNPPLPVNGTLIVPIEEELALVAAGTPVVDKVKQHYDMYFEHTVKSLRYNYQAKTSDQVILPVDIADVRVGRVKDGVLSNFDMFGKKDKLSVYLFQHKTAMKFYGLYKQRMLGWNKGKAPTGMTVEKAINQEALYQFLDIELASDTANEEMMKYLDARLSSKDFDVVSAWVINNRSEAKTDTVVNIIAAGVAKQKLDSLMLR